MEGGFKFTPIENIPEEKPVVESAVETEQESTDRFLLWQRKMFKEGKLSARDMGNELKYIEYALESKNKEDIERALGIAIIHYPDRQDLIEDLYINRENFKEDNF